MVIAMGFGEDPVTPFNVDPSSVSAVLEAKVPREDSMVSPRGGNDRMAVSAYRLTPQPQQLVVSRRESGIRTVGS